MSSNYISDTYNFQEAGKMHKVRMQAQAEYCTEVQLGILIAQQTAGAQGETQLARTNMVSVS